MAYANPLIEQLLDRYSDVLGIDELKYRNHVYRVFLNCLLLDCDPEHEEKYAVAAVFHDIGIWTDNTIDYLPPSIDQARLFLLEKGMDNWIEEITLMILWHHKVTAYIGPFLETVDNFRKADWIDVSLGLLRFGLDRDHIEDIREGLPNRGFHWFLTKRVLKNWVRHPLRPLPMFRR